MIFPEGGNFTPERRQRAIDRLRKLGMERMAAPGRGDDPRARAPSRAASSPRWTAAPDADVVLVAHTGLDHMLTVGDVWRELPMDKQIVMRWWQVPRDEIPGGPRGAHRVALRLVGADRRLDSSRTGRRISPPAGPGDAVSVTPS